MTETHSYHFYAEVLERGAVSFCLDGIHSGPELTARNYVKFKNDLRERHQIDTTKDLIIRTLNKL